MASAGTVGLVLLLLSSVVGQTELDEEKTSVATTMETETTDDNVLLIYPANDSKQILNRRFYVQLNISSQLAAYANYTMQHSNSSFFVGVAFDETDSHSSKMLTISESKKVIYNKSEHYQLFWSLQTDNEANAIPTVNDHKLNRNGFLLTINNLGYPKLEINVLEVQGNNVTVLLREIYQLQAMREERTVDTGFTIVITIVSILNIFAIGCMTETHVLRSQFRKSIIPVSLASGTQYIVTPLLTFGLVKAGTVQPEIGVGMLLCSCVPGGGLGHLIVLVTGNANTELSVAINFLQIFVPLGTVPLWLFSLGQFLKNGIGKLEVPTPYMVMCLGVLILPYLLGILVKRVKPAISEAILNWLIKPLLLLFMILFVTLGLYINMYALGALDNVTLAVAGLIPGFAFCFGGGLTLITKQGKASAKSVGIEAAIMNCLAVIAAVKLTMPQPDSDMACIGAIAILFFTPLPFIGMLIFHKIKKKILNYFENRKFEKEQQETISKTFALITQNALQISGMTADQIKMRRTEETLNNMDKTLISDEEGSERAQTVVQFKDGHQQSIETVSVSHSNHRNLV